MTIPEAFEEDSGTYMVRAMNLAGEAKCYCKLTVKSVSEPMEQEEVMRMKRVVETKETNVNVRREDVEHSPPEFQRLFQDLSVNAGDSVTLECSITGAPKPKVGILCRSRIWNVWKMDQRSGKWIIDSENGSLVQKMDHRFRK